MLWTLLSGPKGRKGDTQGRAFSLWSPLHRLLNPTELVSHWTGVFEKRGIPEAQESSEYIVAHVLGAKTVKCSVTGGRTLGKRPLDFTSLRVLS